MPLCADNAHLILKEVSNLAYDGSIKIDTKIDDSGFKKGIIKITNIAKTGLTAVTASIAAVSAGLVAVGTASAKVGSSFEAAMSKVGAISGATGKDLDALTAKAKEMGAKTKFSASESADAFTYMAMAGWDTKSMLDGIDGIMALSAADGLDLATTSDIVTDALTAFGMQAKDSGHFADVLAKASTSANTNVSMLGESFKYVAPLAGSLGYSVEDMSVALGLMANASIKGSMAGTSLKTALANMAAPTKKMQEVMDKYNLSLTDASGTMKPFSDVIEDLRDKFGDLSEQEQTAAASTLFGKEAMAGMLAIINASDADFKNLTKNINNADGAAQSMADTMQDNLQGQITILKSALEGLGIEIYDSMQNPLKDAVSTGIDYVDKLTQAFKSDGLNGAVSAAGDIFASLATKAAKAAPDMINAATEFIKAFVKGIADNAHQLKDAAKAIVKAMVDGLVSLLPSEVQKPVQKCVKEISKSFNDGGLRNAINTISNIIKNLGKVITNVTKVVLPPATKAIDVLGKGMHILVPTLTAALVAWKAWGIVSGITAMLTANTVAVTAQGVADNIAAMSAGTATAAYSLKSIAVGVLNGTVTLATAAQWLWNAAMSANPIGLAIVAVAALAAGITALVLCQEKEITEAEKIAELNAEIEESYIGVFDAAEKFREGVNRSTGCLEDFNDSIIMTQDKRQELADEMQNVQDEISTIAAIATEERRDLTQKEIDRLEELFKKEQELADKQLEVHSRYQGVVKDMAKDLADTHDMSLEEYDVYAKDYTKSADETKKKVVKSAESQRLNILAEKRSLIGTADQYNEEWYKKEKETADKRYNKVVKTANKEHAETTEILKNGYIAKAHDLQIYINDLETADKDKETAKKSHDQTMNELENERRKAIEEGYSENSGIVTHYDNEIEEEKDRYRESLREIDKKLIAGMDKTTQDQLGVWMLMLADTELYGGKISKAEKEFVKKSLSYLERLPKEGTEISKNLGDGMLEGLEEKEPALYAKAEGIADGIISRLKKAFDIHSPSRVMQKIFGYVWDGAEVATDKAAPKLIADAGDTAKGFVAEAQEKLNKANLVAKMRATVSAAQAQVGHTLTSNVVHTIKSAASQSADDKQVILKGDIQTKIDVDGREVAIATAPYMSEEMAFDE